MGPDQDDNEQSTNSIGHRLYQEVHKGTHKMALEGTSHPSKVTNHWEAIDTKGLKIHLPLPGGHISNIAT